MSTIKNKNNKKINFCVYFLNLVQINLFFIVKSLHIPNICSTFAPKNVGKVSKMALKHVGKVTKIGFQRIGKVTYDRQKHRQNH